MVRLGRTQPIIGLAVMEARTCRFEVVERAVSATKVSTGFLQEFYEVSSITGSGCKGSTPETGVVRPSKAETQALSPN